MTLLQLAQPFGRPEARSADEPAKPGDVLVTRHQSFTGETAAPSEHPSDPPFFVDWLSLYQSHELDLPVIDDGQVIGVDTAGELVWKTCRKKRLAGSFETSVAIRCDGHTVTFEGNVSRFGRTNNLWGFSLTECIRRVNDLLAKLGLPPFTMGRKSWRPVKCHQGGSMLNTGDIQEQWTGARLTRIDLTANYGAGSIGDARAYMEWLATQQHSARVKVDTHADGETVDWGRGSRRIYAKCYLKSAELRRHGAPDDLVQYCDDQGVIRFELTLKSTQLIAMGCQYLGSLDMEQLELLFEERRAVMGRAEHTHDDLADLPNHLRRTARDYLAGDDIAARMKKVTFWRHRKGLLPYGLDIAVKRNVIDFKPRVRVIELRALAAPPWYEFDERKAA
ncbi:phage/plasmid replication domain-containing protein [Methylibium petroleiphilum]|uniref:phage/plasmid replication domain-containing protein n=1 Tax=Methylibium petroleiphilum TaxID=105560 RepID=UPI003D2B0464